MIKKILVIGLLSVFVMPCIVQAAQSNNKYTGARNNYTVTPPKKNDIQSQLNLTPEQKEKARVIRIKSQEKIAPYRNELNELRSYSGKLSPRSAGWKRLRADIRVLEQKIEAIQLENEREFMQILTKSQRSKYNKIKEERRRKLESYARSSR